MIQDTDSPNELACQLYDAVVTVLDKHVSICTRKLPYKFMAPWFNDNIKNAIKKRRNMEKMWRNDRTEINRQIFKNARNDVCTEIDDAKRKFYNDSIEECAGDQKKLFAKSTPSVTKLYLHNVTLSRASKIQHHVPPS